MNPSVPLDIGRHSIADFQRQLATIPTDPRPDVVAICNDYTVDKFLHDLAKIPDVTPDEVEFLTATLRARMEEQDRQMDVLVGAAREMSERYPRPWRAGSRTTEPGAEEASRALLRLTNQIGKTDVIHARLRGGGFIGYPVPTVDFLRFGVGVASFLARNLWSNP